tara:strand:- start:406 stop:1296 length:891 start_codon:yes stop_codon:yes gene_type:complete
MADFDWLEFLKGSSPLLGLLGGGAALTGAYDRLGGIGEAAQQGAMQIAQEGLEQTAFQPYGVTTTTGSTFGFDPVTGKSTLTSSEAEKAFQQQLFGDAQSMFTSAAGDTGEREQAVYERLRAAQRPEEERQRQALEERMQSQGRLGVRTSMFGGTPEQLAMSKAQAEAQNTAMLGAMQQAQAEQAQQAALGQQMLGASYMPQAQLLQAMQGSELYPQLQQKGQLYGAGLYGEGAMGGLEALLGAGLGQANLMGQLGTGLLSGLATPTDSYGGLGEVFGGASDIYDQLFGKDGLFDF